jgi:hypothetical protein
VSPGSGGLLGLGAAGVFDLAGRWVAEGASWILAQVVAVVSATTAPPLSTAWFHQQLGVMAAAAAALAVPLACCAAVQAVLSQQPGLLLRAVVVHLPFAVAGAGTAVALVQLGLVVVDGLCQQLLTASGTTPARSVAPVAQALGAGVLGAAPSFAVLLGAVVVAVAGLTLWLEMAVRAAAVTVAVLFLPLILATTVWPALAHWCRRLAETLAALVLAKLVIVGALALATEAMAHGLAFSAGDGFGALVSGAALLVVAAAAPFTLLRLIPVVEAGAVAQLEAARHHLRRAAGAPRRLVATGLDLWETFHGPADPLGTEGFGASPADVGELGDPGSDGAGGGDLLDPGPGGPGPTAPGAPPRPDGSNDSGPGGLLGPGTGTSVEPAPDPTGVPPPQAVGDDGRGEVPFQPPLVVDPVLVARYERALARVEAGELRGVDLDAAVAAEIAAERAAERQVPEEGLEDG